MAQQLAGICRVQLIAIAVADCVVIAVQKGLHAAQVVLHIAYADLIVTIKLSHTNFRCHSSQSLGLATTR